MYLLNAIIVVTSVPLVACYPWNIHETSRTLSTRDDPVPVRQPTFLSGRPNTGSAGPATAFNATAQYVDVGQGSGHEWKAPRPTDQRGPCPGLNAAANHGFLPRNGIPTLQQTIRGLQECYNVDASFPIFGGVLGVAYAGDFLTTKWSIGGEFPSSAPGLLSNPQGLLATHNKYESDQSPTRTDAHLASGNSTNAFSMPHFEHLYGLANEYSMDHVAAHHEYVHSFSIHRNPYFFVAPVLGTIISAAYNLAVVLFSTCSAEHPNGVLTRDNLMSFYSVSGEPGSFVYTPGHERIPANFYKGPSSNAYTLGAIGSDILINNAMYPGLVSLGGNTGQVDSFVGVDTGDLTAGVYNAATLLEGNNLICFALQASMAAMLSQLAGIVSIIRELLSWVRSELDPVLADLDCPQLAGFNNSLFDLFPGPL